ncbi:MAG: hypothetical protein IJL96_03275 [Clostridia bacterium]|nr:hypothetical protein [Clostridia bacterium]
MVLRRAAWTPAKKVPSKDEKHCQMEKTCVSTNESEMLSNQNDEIAQRAGGYEHD